MKSLQQKIFAQPEWLIATVVTAIIICLHFFLWLHAGGFCGDEVDTINLANRSSFSGMAEDSFPVLMPMLVKSWSAIGLGDSDFELRLLGVLIGIGISLALWLPPWKICRAPPLMSVTLFGLNSMVIFREDYLRAYGIGSLLVVLTLFAMLRLLENPTWRRTIFFALAAILSVQSLFQNAVFIAAICLSGWTICWFRKNKSAALKIFIGGFAAAISLLPYLKFILLWTNSTSAIRPGFSFAAAADNFNRIAGFPLSQYVWIWILLALFVIAKSFLNCFKSQPVQAVGQISSMELRIFSGIVLLASAIGYFLFLKFAALITSPWYFLPLLALAAICLDLSISLAEIPRNFRAVICGILLATIGISTAFSFRDLNCRFTNVDMIANRLSKEISPQDYVVVTPWYFGISFNHYYRGAAAWDTLPPVADHSTYRFDLIQAQNQGASQKIFDRIADTLQSGHRVWIVGLMDAPSPGTRAHSDAAQFIANRSQSFEKNDLKLSGPVSDYEEESLLVASGWKTNSP